jgi:hypothetical protein
VELLAGRAGIIFGQKSRNESDVIVLGRIVDKMRMRFA